MKKVPNESTAPSKKAAAIETEATNKKLGDDQMKETKQTTVTKELLVQIKKVVADKETSTSEKIRALVKLGLTKSEVARILDIRYQFVYQVIKNSSKQKDSSAQNKRDHQFWSNLLNDIE